MTAPTPPGAQALNLRVLLEEVIERGASDLHITAGERPMLRIDGDMTRSNIDFTLQPKDTLQLAYSVLTENQKKRFETEDELDFSFGIQNLARFRGNCFKQRGCVSMVIRQIPFNIKTFDDLKLPKVIADLSDKPRGLILVTGPTGSGKSTTLAAMLDKINKEMKGHMITIEDPIEFIHKHQNCIVNQREVGSDTKSFQSALKYALRQDPDVVLIGEMRDLETIQAGLTSLRPDTWPSRRSTRTVRPRAINRIIDVFPAAPAVAGPRAAGRSVSRGIITQTLLPKMAGKAARWPPRFSSWDAAIRALIRDDKIHQIYSMMQSGKKYGMQTMNDALYQLYMSKTVALEEVLRATLDQGELMRMIGIAPEGEWQREEWIAGDGGQKVVTGCCCWLLVLRELAAAPVKPATSNQ
jgi:twitching motility protein PilT